MQHIRILQGKEENLMNTSHKLNTGIKINTVISMKV